MINDKDNVHEKKISLKNLEHPAHVAAPIERMYS